MFNYRTVTSRPFFHPQSSSPYPASFASTGTIGVTAPNSHPGSIGVTAHIYFHSPNHHAENLVTLFNNMQKMCCRIEKIVYFCDSLE